MCTSADRECPIEPNVGVYDLTLNPKPPLTPTLDRGGYRNCESLPEWLQEATDPLCFANDTIAFHIVVACFV